MSMRAETWSDMAKEAAEAYERKLQDYINSRCCLPPSSLELRQKHAEVKFEVVDQFRKNSVGENVGVWKVEREIANIFSSLETSSRKVRKASLTEMDFNPLDLQALSCLGKCSKPTSPWYGLSRSDGQLGGHRWTSSYIDWCEMSLELQSNHSLQKDALIARTSFQAMPPTEWWWNIHYKWRHFN